VKKKKELCIKISKTKKKNKTKKKYKHIKYFNACIIHRKKTKKNKKKIEI